jgi:phospholipid/cholesterol/gamma-HCH transport system substrate-binding protein
MPPSVKNVLIGIFVIAAMCIIAYMLLFLHPKVGDNAKTIRVRFTDVDKVNVGTRVTFAGRPVGEVISIQELPEARTGRTTEKGDIYVYELVLKVDSSVDIFNSDTIGLRTSGLLGERNVEINPQPLQPGQHLRNVEEEILYAEITTSVEETMKEIGELTKKFGVVLDDLHDFMLEIKKDEIVHFMKKSVENVIQITDSLNHPEKWEQTLNNIVHISEKSSLTVDNFHIISERLKTSTEDIALIMEDIQTTTQNAVVFSEKANVIIDHTLQGEGSVGKLFMKDDSYLRFKSILHKGEVVMNDINTYGLLFHSNKRWQRLQAKRLGMLEKLSNPMLFNNYFNDEITLIGDSLSRVSFALDEAESYPQSLLCDPKFTKQFAELLQQVEQMSENLKMYNEQIVDQDKCPCMNE